MGKHVHENSQKHLPSTSINGQLRQRPFASPGPEHESFGWEARYGHSFGQMDLYPKTMIQPKLRIDREGDMYEWEVDGLVRQSTNKVQKSEELDGKTKNPIEDNASVRFHNENKTGMLDDLKLGLENITGLTMSDVRIHYNSPKPAQLHAQAYTQDTDIHLGPHQEKHLEHELGHVVQQKEGRVRPTGKLQGFDINDDYRLEKEADAMKARLDRFPESIGAGRKTSYAMYRTGIVQGYFDRKYLISNWRQANDMTMATKIGYPNHEFYAKAGKVSFANSKLAAVNSGIELIETSKEMTIEGKPGSSPKQKQKIKKVKAKNKENNSQGDDMLLYADCGKSSAVVVGGVARQAVYTKPSTSVGKIPGSPSSMKIAIIKAWMEHIVTDPDIFKYIKPFISLIAANEASKDLDSLYLDLIAAKDDKEKKKIKADYAKKLYEVGDAYWDYYNKLPEDQKDDIDKALKINRYAKPSIGQGFTISSGGPSAGKSTWNFHWGGVIMTSDDGEDRVVLENYAVGNPNVENKLWTFDMYGMQKGQTFHERHKETKQHGTTPTTMTIEKTP